MLLLLLFVPSLAIAKKSLRTKSNHPINIEPNPISCMADAIYYEAGNQPTIGKFAIGRVIINRVHAGKSAGFENSVCGVVHQRNNSRCQFSFSCKINGHARINYDQYAKCVDVAQAVIQQDLYCNLFTSETLYFNNKKNGLHFSGIKRVAVIGNHVFYEKRIRT